jgi:hypothetical protein
MFLAFLFHRSNCTMLWICFIDKCSSNLLNSVLGKLVLHHYPRPSDKWLTACTESYNHSCRSSRLCPYIKHDRRSRPTAITWVVRSGWPTSFCHSSSEPGCSTSSPATPFFIKFSYKVLHDLVPFLCSPFPSLCQK